MEAGNSSKTPVNIYHTTGHHISEVVFFMVTAVRTLISTPFNVFLHTEKTKEIILSQEIKPQLALNGHDQVTRYPLILSWFIPVHSGKIPGECHGICYRCFTPHPS
jgi:hypothetical protein